MFILDLIKKMFFGFNGEEFCIRCKTRKVRKKDFDNESNYQYYLNHYLCQKCQNEEMKNNESN